MPDTQVTEQPVSVDFDDYDYPPVELDDFNDSPYADFDGCDFDEADEFDGMTDAEYREAWEMGELYYQWIVELHQLEVNFPRFGARDADICPPAMWAKRFKRKPHKRGNYNLSLRDMRRHPEFHRSFPHCESKANTLKPRTVRLLRQSRQAEREFLLSDFGVE